MTNKELVLSLYPKAKIGKTTFGYTGFHANLKQRYYIRNADSVISNRLYESPAAVWKNSAQLIKKAVLEKLGQ